MFSGEDKEEEVGVGDRDGARGEVDEELEEK